MYLSYVTIDIQKKAGNQRNQPLFYSLEKKLSQCNLTLC